MEAAKLRFSGSDTNIQTPTVKLAGKLRLSNSVVVVFKDQVNYISQDAWHRVTAIPPLVPVVLGKWSPSYLET